MPAPIRGRRLRRTETLRRMVRETELDAGDFIYPIFVEEGSGLRRPIPSMPGISNLSIDTAVEEAKKARDLGIPSLLLFGIPPHKDEIGSQGYAEDGVIPRALRAIKEAVPELVLVTDVCMCEYTTHGHCGVIHDGDVDNERTLPLLAKTAVVYAQAGADIVAPADMMDNRVAAIRGALDESGFGHTPIMSYAAKYASAFYGPFRDAAQSAPSHGDRRGYQMDPANGREAIRMVKRDVEEGADLIIVKPALAYLDVIRDVRQALEVPVVAYNVSGEYAMLKAAAQNGWIDGERAVLESLTSMKRAGADLIITYHALEAARALARR
ncbi:porphobilinogen synthase [Vulgatibacter sp.]|uniref:porphobilinogen synthase n=1 Tax=Vulgatibacter sp. TaxID=1971226 RepID=UPI0035661161